MNIGSAITKLAEAGAEDILIMNLPNLGATPLNNSDPAAAAGAQYVSGLFNAGLESALNDLALFYSDVNFYTPDVYQLLEDMINNPACFGFDNVTDMLSTAGETTDNYLFWDSIHPTTLGHAVLAEYAYAEIMSVPEPLTLIYFALALFGMGIMKRRFRR